MSYWDSKSIKDVLYWMEKGEWVLPVMQRNFVWKADQIEALFESIFLEHSFGGIMTLKQNDGDTPLFHFRPFIDHADSRVKLKVPSRQFPSDTLSKNIHYVIDGQQRLQSLMIGLKGLLDGRTLSFNLLSKLHNDDEEDIWFSFRGKEGKFKNNPKKRLWINSSFLFDELQRSSINPILEIIKRSHWNFSDRSFADARDTIRDNIFQI